MILVLSYTAHKSLADSTGSKEKVTASSLCKFLYFGSPASVWNAKGTGQCQPLEKDIREYGGKDRYECCKKSEGRKTGHLRRVDIYKMLSVALTQIHHAGLLVFARFFAGQEIATDTLPVCLSQPRSL